MITIDEITGDIVPEAAPASDGDRDERPRASEDRLDERLRHLLNRRRQRGRRLTDR